MTLATVLCASCDSGVSLPPPPTIVPVIMRDYRFEFNSHIASGRAVFQVHNAGRVDHQMEVLALPPDVPTIVPRPHPPSGQNFALSPLVNLPVRPPGANGTIAADLRPGRYGLFCFVVDPDRVQHTFKGMQAEFRVQ